MLQRWGSFAGLGRPWTLTGLILGYETILVVRADGTM